MEAPTEEWVVAGIVGPGGPTTTMVVPGFSSKELAEIAKKEFEDKFEYFRTVIFTVVQTK